MREVWQGLLVVFFIIFVVGVLSPCNSFSAGPTGDVVSQYIIELTRDINKVIESVAFPDRLDISKAHLGMKLKLCLSPWGEVKDAYVSKTSGDNNIDQFFLKAICSSARYQPFPNELGDKDIWLDIPLVFKPNDSSFNAEPDLEKVTYQQSSTDSGGDGNGIVINKAVDTALYNHLPAKIAEEEIELSELKIREARRSLYPASSLNYLETTGKTTGTTQDFIDKEYKIKFEYPLYYGWRLKYAVQQAISNMNASRYNYNNVIQDLRVEVEEAFYSYLVNRINVGVHKTLLFEVEKLFDIAKKRFDRELITKTELLKVEAQLKQVSYQIASSENDLALARITLAQAMNVKRDEDIERFIEDEYMDIIDVEDLTLNISLEGCLDLAFRYRPDLKSKGFIVQFNDYGYKIVESKNQLKVDLTGSYGRSGGAYQSETLKTGPDWFVGVRLSKPLGGNTLSSGYTKEETSEKHGQSSRTEALSKSVELGLLDNLASLSEKKSTNIEYKKAEEAFQATKDAILKEVNQAYMDYRKGLVQTQTNLKKVKYREEELKIAKVRAELNEISLSDIIEAHISLADEKAYYADAVGSLYQALVRLNKSTGYSLFLDSESFMLANTPEK